MLWFNVAHYILRSWLWIITALASLILIPDSSLLVTQAGQSFVDHERAYPRLITTLLPVGLRGVMVAAFFAAYMSTVDSQINWGSSYLVNDLYKRFLKKTGSESHYVFISRIFSFCIAVFAAGVSFYIQSIGAVFTFVLNLTAGVGPVYLLRWFWWRINAWSEIAAMTASLPLLLLRTKLFSALGIPENSITHLLYMILGAALFWLPVTLMTSPVPEKTLKEFFARVSPPGFWKNLGERKTQGKVWLLSLRLWLIATTALFSTLIGPLQIFFGHWPTGSMLCLLALLCWLATVRRLTHLNLANSEN